MNSQNEVLKEMKELQKSTILIVDDTETNIDILVDALEDDYEISVAMDGESALEVVESEPPDIILLDIMMPGVDGYEVCRRLKANIATRKIPVIFLTAKTEVKDEKKGLELGAVDYITKPISLPIVQARVKTHLSLYDQNRALEGKVRQRTAELNDTRLEIIRRLGRAAEYKDNETGLHVIRMSHYSRLIALASGMSYIEADLLLNAAPMHDIGKIGIPDRVLLKPDKLNDDEWKIIRKHPAFGYEIIGEHKSELLEEARTVALTHHEKWNGTGYPSGIKEDEIPVSGRIVAIADVFDALTSKRPYKQPWPVEKTVDLMKEESGQHFDPKYVQAFLDAMPDVLKIKEQYAEKHDQ